MPDKAPSSRFARAMLTTTLAFWVVVYMVFTVRSFALHQPHLEVQALLRLVMMPIGLLLCGGLFVAFTRLAGQSLWRQLAQILPLVLAASVVYAVINYGVFYVTPGLWPDEHGALSKVTTYVTTGFFWIFASWTAIFYLTKARFQPDSAMPAAELGNGNAAYPETLWVRDRDRSLRVPLSEIIWVEAEGDYVRLHTSERSYLLRSTMTNLEQTLDPIEFIRIHRRTIIAVGQLSSLRRQSDGRLCAELDDGTVLPVGRHYLSKLKGVASSVTTKAGEATTNPVS